MRILIGFQLCKRNGKIVQGDFGDLSDFTSYQVMSYETTKKVLESLDEDEKYLLTPIFEDDIEGYEIV